MTVTQVISSVDEKSGGTSTYIKLLLEGIVENTTQNLIAFDSASNLDIDHRVKKHLAKPHILSMLYSKPINDLMKQSDTDLFHGHGLWQYPVHSMSKYARKRRIPYIISTHGMLEPWSLGQSRVKKELALRLYQSKDLKQATCIHATAEAEARNIRKLGFKNPIAVIPNGIDLNEFAVSPKKLSKGKKKLLFLSRIHPKKGIELLVAAWQQLPEHTRQNWQIEIAGNGEEKYIASLQKLINQKKLDAEIKIIGPQFGDPKIATYHQADLFVLPTYSENFGIVVAEALACEIPVITTKGTPWEELNTHKAGWWIDIGVPPLVEALSEALLMSAKERQIMGRNGRKLVEEKYSIEAVAAQMNALYQWILNGGKEPGFVMT